MMKPVLENPLILRLSAPAIALFNILLSAYIYSNFNNVVTLLPALFGIGTALLIWREAERLEAGGETQAAAKARACLTSKSSR